MSEYLNERVNALSVVVWVVNLIVLSTEVRVVSVMYALSGSWLTAAFSVFGTGAMFIVWYDVIAEHPLASGFQIWLDRIFTAWSLLVGAVFVFADYATKIYVNGESLISLEFLMKLLSISILANVIGLILWYKADRGIRDKHKLAKELAVQSYKAQQMANKTIVAKQARGVLRTYRELEDDFGSEALGTLGVEVPELAGKDKQDVSPKV